MVLRHHSACPTETSARAISGAPKQMEQEVSWSYCTLNQMSGEVQVTPHFMASLSNCGDQ